MEEEQQRQYGPSHRGGASSRKIDPSGRAGKMFMSIPGQLSRNMVRYVPYSVVGEVEESVMSTLLTDLEDSRTVLFAHHVDDPNIGMGLAENLTKYKLFYHTWPKDDKHYYEIDFLLSRGSKLCPLEVKSSANKSHASLDEFCRKYSSRISRDIHDGVFVAHFIPASSRPRRLRSLP